MKKILYKIYYSDAILWLKKQRTNSIAGVVTDPPYGLREYTPEELDRKKNGNGIWRIPNGRDGAKRKASPRFTILTQQDQARLKAFVLQVSSELFRVIKPGGHIIWASHPILSHIVVQGFCETGFENRGAIIRLYTTLRGGERPKNISSNHDESCVIPKGCWEPWLLLRKPLVGTISKNIKKYGTGALRRISDTEPFKDTIASFRPTDEEKGIAPHPSLKPQSFLRQIVRAVLPIGKGIVLDPFMGSGSTIAAANYLGYQSIGIEINKQYFDLAKKAIPKLSLIANGTT
ncbi:MAG: site-specific DNA-methyltransferase [Acidobacteria bacterium]|nr:site-specific DNA-methyltransferase [Acidobacteriota bacterium]